MAACVPLIPAARPKVHHIVGLWKCIKSKKNKKTPLKYLQVFKDHRKKDKTLVKKLQMKPPACVERIRAQSRDVLLPAWHSPRPRQSHRRASLHSHPALCSTPSLHRAQMSMQFTAHSKLDHSSGVLFSPGTCYFSPCLFKKNQTKKSGRVGGRADLRSKLQDGKWEERKTFEEEVQSNGEAVLYAQAWSSEWRFSVSPSELRCHINTSATISISSLIQRLWKQNKMRGFTSIHFLLQASLNECKKWPQGGRIYFWHIRNANNGKIKDIDSQKRSDYNI